MNLLILNGTIITMHKRKIIRESATATEGKDILKVGKTNELKRKYARGYEKIEAAGRVVIPGLINTHQHAAMSLLQRLRRRFTISGMAGKMDMAN